MVLSWSLKSYVFSSSSKMLFSSALGSLRKLSIYSNFFKCLFSNVAFNHFVFFHMDLLSHLFLQYMISYIWLHSLYIFLMFYHKCLEWYTHSSWPGLCQMVPRYYLDTYKVGNCFWILSWCCMTQQLPWIFSNIPLMLESLWHFFNFSHLPLNFCM